MFGNMIKENGNIIISTSEAKAFTLKFDNYKAMVIRENQLFDLDYAIPFGPADIIIVGYDADDKKRTDDIKPNILYTDRDIMDSLIALSQKYTIDSILAWCYKYGFPIYNVEIYKRYKCFGFYHHLFTDKISSLLTCFIEAAKFLDVDIGIDNINSNNSHGIRLIFRQNITLDDMKNDICSLLNNIDVKYEYRFIGNQLISEVELRDLMSLAIYQLAFLLMSPNEMTISKCKLCGSLFPAYSKKEKYCHNPCYPQLAYKRKKLLYNEGKEGESNSNHNTKKK